MNERLYYLDWLRVIAIVILHFYHSASIFTPPHFMIKNEELSPLLGEINQFFHEWRLALLFLISGAGTAFALGFRNANKYVSERTKRLLIPLFFGIIVIIPPQVYIERLSQGFEFSSFFEFLKNLPASGLYPAGNISWHHLWFVAYLFVYSLLALPLFMYWREKSGQQKTSLIKKRLKRPENIIFLSIPIIAATVLLTPFSTGVQNIVNDSANFISYFFFFVFGYLFHKENLWEKLSQGRIFYLKVAFVCVVILYYLRWTQQIPEPHFTTHYVIYQFVKALNSWAWVITITGFGVRYLNIKSNWIMKANNVIYPFYILHQTLIVIVAHYILPYNDSIFMKFIFISVFSLVLDVAIIYIMIKPFRRLSILFGIKNEWPLTAK